MNKMKPCPFCGGKDLEVQYNGKVCNHEGILTNIVCADCGARGPSEYIDNKDIDIEIYAYLTGWNKRFNEKGDE